MVIFSWARGFGLLLARARVRAVLAVAMVVGFALAGTPPAAAAPFVYIVDFSNNDLFQFDAPLRSFEALNPLRPAAVGTGEGPVAVAVTPDGTSAYVANVFGNSVSQYSIDGTTGRLSAKSPATVPTGNNPRAMAVSPDGRSVYVTSDAGIAQYTIDPSTGLLSHKSHVATGFFPDAVAVSPDGKSAYFTKDNNNTVLQYTIDPSTGKLSPKSPATVAAGRDPVAVAVSPDGTSAYVANRDDDTVSQYSIDPATGVLTPKSPAIVATGSSPTAVAVSSDGKSAYVTNALDSTVSQYSIDGTTGALSPKSPPAVATGINPEGVAVTPDGRSAYVTAGPAVQYSIDPITGALSPKSPSAVAAGDFPRALAVTPDANLWVDVDAPTSVRSGARLTYTIRVPNGGPSSAWQVTLKDVLPYGTAFESAQATSGQCTAKTGTVTCQLGTIKRRQSPEVRILVKVTAANHAAIIDGAKVSNVTPDPVHGNNKDHTTTKVKN